MDVRLPNLGEGSDSGTVVTLLVKEGEAITVGQNVIELENGKAVVGVPSSAAGTVEQIRVKPGDRVSIGQVLLSVKGSGAATAAAGAAPAAAAKPAKAVAPRPESAERRPAPVVEEDESVEVEDAETSAFPPPASPTLRKLARDLGINLHRIQGSEAGGRIVLADVRDYIQRLQKRAAAGAKSAVPARTAPTAPSVDFAKWGPIRRQPMTSLRKVISQRMVESWTTIPHVTQFDEADITRLMDLRRRHKAAYEAKGASLTLTVLILKALVETLKKHPIFNVSVDDATQEIVFKDYYHIGIAVDTDAGLIVPVIRNVDQKSLLQIAQDLASVAEKTRERKVGMEELSGGSFTVSNQGGIGGAHFTPIVNKPEVAILGLGRGLTKPVCRDGGKIEAGTLLPVALSYDHRVIDGGSAARFIKDFLTALEQFPEAAVTL